VAVFTRLAAAAAVAGARAGSRSDAAAAPGEDCAGEAGPLTLERPAGGCDGALVAGTAGEGWLGIAAAGAAAEAGEEPTGAAAPGVGGEGGATGEPGETDELGETD
jgi:hypothetical protein